MAPYVLDTYAWIEYFRGSGEGENVKEAVEGGDDVLTPSIVMAELSDKYRRQGLGEVWKVRRHFVRMVSDILDLDDRIADRAGGIKQELREWHDDAGLADAIVLAHGREEGLTVLTGDKHLTNRDGVEDLSASG